MNKTKYTVIAAIALMLTVALFAGLSSSAQAADAPEAQQTWYCDPGVSNRGIQFTLDNLAKPGDIICLWPSPTATTTPVYFYENVFVNYSVTILGLNHGKVAYDPRNPESYVYPRDDGRLRADSAVFTVLADNVTIDGVFIGANGTFAGLPVRANHGIYAPAALQETSGMFGYLAFANNFIETAPVAIKLEGDGRYSDNNVIEGNFALKYFGVAETFIGFWANDNMFVTMENNKARNIENPFMVENYDVDGTITIVDNIIQNDRVMLNIGIQAFMLNGDDTTGAFVLNIGGNEITSFFAVGAPAAEVEHVLGVADPMNLGIYVGDIGGYDYYYDQILINVIENSLSTLSSGMLFEELDIYTGYPVYLTGNTVSDIYWDGIMVWNSGENWVKFEARSNYVSDCGEDAFELWTETDLPTAPGDIENSCYVIFILADDIVITDVDIGFDIEGQGTIVTSPADAYRNKFYSVWEFYFDLWDNMVDIDATRMAIEDELGSEMNFLMLFDVENMTFHAIDVQMLGFVMWVEDTGYVSQGNQIQNAIEIYDHDGAWINDHVLFADTVYVQWGQYDGDECAMQVEGVYIWRPVALLGVTSQWGGTIGEIPTLYYDVDNDPQYLIMIEDTAGVLVDNFELLGNNLPAASFSGVTASGRAMESGAADDAPADPAVSTCDGVIVRTNNKPVYDISLVNLDIAYCDGVGIKFIGYGLPFSDILIDGCEFYALSYQGIYMQVTFEDLMYDEELLINYDIIITGCEFVNTLMAMPDDTYGATIELWGIMDTLITDNYFLGSGAGGSTYSEYLWYMALIVTGESVLVTQNVLDTWIGGDAQNGVYVETDAAEEHVHGRFTAYTPVFHYNQFWLYITEDAYAIDYYEGGLATGEDWEADVIDATKNFWWDNVIYSGRGDLGPYSDPNHDYNPNEDGTGCQVQDYINFAPWYMDRYLRYLTCDVFISLDKNVQRAYVEGDPIYYMIQWAVDDAEAGDWVIVNPGQYYEDVLVGKSIFLLGGYTQRGGFLMPMMWGAGELVAIVQVFTPGILAPAGSSSLGASLSAAAPGVAVEETSATVDFFNFVGDSWILVDVYTATAVVSNNAFIGSDGWYYGQIGVCVEQYSTASVFGNYFDHVSQDTWQEYGAVGVWSGSSAEIYDNIFEGNYEETAVWAWDVVEPLNIMENSIEGFYYGVNIDKYLGDDVGSTGVYIGGNFIDDCLIGVNLNTVEETLVEENTIIGAETEVPVAPGIDDWEYEYSFDVLVYAAGENVVVTHNNLLTWGNQDDTVGIWNAWSLGDGWSDVAADDNYWGKPSGPSGAFWAWDDWEVDSPYDWNYAMWDAWGAGTIVTFNVTYTTWFGMPISIGFSVTAVFDAPIYVDDFTALDPYYSEDTNIEIVSASGDGYVVLGKYLDPEDVETSMNPVTGFWGYNVKLYFEISVWHESEDLDSLTVRLYFDDGDLDGININELRLFFWSQDAFGWIPCVFSAVNADEMYVEITFSEESLPSMDMLRNDMPFLIGAPKVVITPAEGKSGITVTGWAAGFMPGQAVTVYLGSSLMGALPTQVKGIYIVDMNGNITEIEFILPYLNKGVYQITVTDPAWFMEYEVEYYATTTYTVLGNSPLLLSLDVGAMYFAGEIVNWVFSVTEEGTPYDVTPDMITAYLVYAPSLEEVQVPAENILQVDADTFVVTMALPGDAMVGEYYLEVFVADEMYQGAAGKAFLVSQTFGDIIPMLVSIEDGIMNLQAGCDALQVSVDAVKAVVDRIDGNVVSIKTTLGVVKTTVDQINVKVTDIQGTLVTMQAQINGGFSQVQSKLEDISAQIASVDDGIVTLQTSVGVVQTTLNAIGAKVVTIENGVAELQTSMGEVQLALVAIAATVDDIDGNVVTLQTAVGTVQTTLNQLGASIVAIDGKIVSLQTAVGTVQTTLNAIGVTVEKIEGRTVYMNSTLGQITGTLASMTGTLATINTNVGTIKTDVSNISSNTTGINSLVSFIILLVLLIVAIVLIFLRTQKK